MEQAVVIRANRAQEYVVLAVIAGATIGLVVDTGFTHASGEVSVSLDHGYFQTVRGRLSRIQDYTIQSIGGRSEVVEGGVGVVSLPGLPASGIVTHIVDAGANLLGVSYFHRLPNHALEWDFERRTMTISERG